MSCVFSIQSWDLEFSLVVCFHHYHSHIFIISSIVHTRIKLSNIHSFCSTAQSWSPKSLEWGKQTLSFNVRPERYWVLCIATYVIGLIGQRPRGTRISNSHAFGQRFALYSFGQSQLMQITFILMLAFTHFHVGLALAFIIGYTVTTYASSLWIRARDWVQYPRKGMHGWLREVRGFTPQMRITLGAMVNKNKTVQIQQANPSLQPSSFLALAS